MKRGGELLKDAEAIPTRPAPGRGPGTTWWLVAKDGHLRKELLTVNCGGGRALPVFSGEGEAEMYVWLGGAFEDSWRIRETSTGELISILCGPCESVRSVALDPSPGMKKVEIIDLVTVTRERFLDRIVAPNSRMPGTSSLSQRQEKVLHYIIGRIDKSVPSSRYSKKTT